MSTHWWCDEIEPETMTDGFKFWLEARARHELREMTGSAEPVTITWFYDLYCDWHAMRADIEAEPLPTARQS